MLLYSYPDTVHKFPSREAQTSTLLTTGSSKSDAPRHIITPSVADCRYRAPLSPRLHGIDSIMVFLIIVNQNKDREKKRKMRVETERKCAPRLGASEDCEARTSCAQ